MRARKPKRKYSFKSIQARIEQAETEEELELISDLLDELGQFDGLKASEYRELDFMLDDRLSTIVLEGKI